MEEAEFMRDAWISTFKEMKFHMKPEKLRNSTGFGNQFGFRDDEEEYIDPSEQDRQLYRAKLINGMVRNRCSFNAACNMQFQGLVAFGAKLAGWNLVTHGYEHRVVNFVHDEFLYCLYPEELKVHIPVIERLMIDGMRVAIPDVKVGVESSVMRHWDKKATEFHDVKWDEQGRPLIEEPLFVQSVLKMAQ
jgi:hypothetical protein